jgi:cell division ATPase FtsA
MKNNLENKIFLFLGIDKFTIVALNSIDEEVYKEEILKDNKSNKIDLNFLDNFLNENIFKIEKKLNEFVKNIFLIIDHQNIFSVHLSIKNKFDNININFDSMHKLLLEAKSCCKKTLEDLDILHMKIDQFYIDGTYFKTLPKKKNCNNLSIDISYICLPKKISKTIENVLRKYQISLDRMLSLNYLKSFLDDKNENLYATAQKILNGFNENEVFIADKNSKKLSFFEKFFDFFN